LIADKIFALTLTVGLLIGLIFVCNKEDTDLYTKTEQYDVRENKDNNINVEEEDKQ
jgi:hypothetical protein